VTANMEALRQSLQNPEELWNKVIVVAGSFATVLTVVVICSPK
jgi:hypothetical protein